MSYHFERFSTENSGVRILPAASEVGIYTAAYFCGYFLEFGTTNGATLLDGRSCSLGACGRRCNRGPLASASCAGTARTPHATNIVAKNAVIGARFITAAVYVCAERFSRSHYRSFGSANRLSGQISDNPENCTITSRRRAFAENRQLRLSTPATPASSSARSNSPAPSPRSSPAGTFRSPPAPRRPASLPEPWR